MVSGPHQEFCLDEMTIERKINLKSGRPQTTRLIWLEELSPSLSLDQTEDFLTDNLVLFQSHNILKSQS